MSTANKYIVLITGANKGLGYEAAKLLLADSSKYLVLVGSRTISNGDEASKSLSSLTTTKGTVETVQIDVSSDESISAAAEDVTKRFGRLDALINNAGIFRDRAQKPLREIWHDTYETNVFGAAATTEAFIPLLRKSTAPQGASLVFVTSGLGSIEWFQDHPKGPYSFIRNIPAYRSSKAALNMLMVHYEVELGKKRDEDPADQKPMKIWGVDPGYRHTTFSGDAEGAKSMGATEPELGGVEIVKWILKPEEVQAGKVTSDEGIRPN
ncbi:hypothetical protein MMC25_005561 [Agyrium rufum]|nr:hypothetical protein [Agyrium rufum]